jgi:hypothetical protein
VDRLEQVPDRLGFLFGFDAATALARPDLRNELEAARPVVAALAEELRNGVPLLDREAFRACANRVKEKTGQRGKALFHPIRVILTAEAEGLELDVAVPAIERGAAVTGTATEAAASSGLRRIASARDRAAEFARLLASQ